ncbi:hypothetical protein EZV62_016699 [Acer yangbiense]|uniref:Cytochrome P450 n=1 Tax=Acer yangbiense TaxID=1000413 RepID=A0A5C7HP60_9ROSI|nr:hypothetical protein EZV62_016699 [Acer yangbiense]
MEMEAWFIIIVSISIAALLKAFINLLFPAAARNLPPGPANFPILGNGFLWLRRSSSETDAVLLGNLHAKFGPLVTLHIGSRPVIFVADRSLAHKALVQKGAVFAERPSAPATNKVSSSNQHNISSGFYGPMWRVLRRNLTSEILHPSRVKSYKHARKWVLQILMDSIKSESKKNGDHHPVCVIDHFQYAMFCLLVFMCFGDKLDEKQIKEIEQVQRRVLFGYVRYNILNFWPRLTKIVLRSKWVEFLQTRKDQENILIPLIRARKKLKEENLSKATEDDQYVLSYVDTLLDLQLPEEKRKLNEEEIVTLCSEFINGGTDTTSTALQWIMANLVKYSEIQEKLYMEIKGIMNEEDEVEEDKLQKLPYLKAVILEGLRRHPPGYLVLPHAVTEDVELGGYTIPKNATINFTLAEMAWDPKVWEDPMAFKPERFLNGGDGTDHDDHGDKKIREVFDITGSREIKMMPFGVGRRICPAVGLAMLHLEYFVANLVWSFEWKAVEGNEVDLSEKQEFTVVMKNPLQAIISPRIM